MRLSLVMSNETSCPFLSRLSLSCIGPRSGFKLIVSESSEVSVSTTCRRLVSLVSCLVDDFVGDFILDCCKRRMEKMIDHNLTFIYLSSEVTSILRSVESEREVAHLLLLLNSILEESVERVRIKLDLDNVKGLHCLSSSVLQSKPFVTKSLEDHSKLTMEFIKGFLHCFQNDQFRAELFTHVVQQDREDITIVDGLLLPSPSSNEAIMRRIIRESSGVVKVLLLDLQLRSEGKELSQLETVQHDHMRLTRAKFDGEMIEHVRLLIDWCRVEHVEIVFNQRVMDEQLREMFFEAQIDVVHRLGSLNMDTLMAMTEAKPLTSLTSDTKALPKECIANLTQIQMQVTHDDRRFVVVQGMRGRCRSIRVSHPNEQVCKELEVLLEQMWTTLVSVMRSEECNFLLPGAGCLEACLIANVMRRRGDFKDVGVVGQLVAVLSNLAVQKCGGVIDECQLDLDHHHLWTKTSRDSKCSCGLLTANGDMELMSLLEIKCSSPTSFFDQNQPKSAPLTLSNYDVVVEQGQSFELMFKMALDTAASLASIGTVIHI